MAFTAIHAGAHQRILRASDIFEWYPSADSHVSCMEKSFQRYSIQFAHLPTVCPTPISYGIKTPQAVNMYFPKTANFPVVVEALVNGLMFIDTNQPPPELSWNIGTWLMTARYNLLLESPLKADNDI